MIRFNFLLLYFVLLFSQTGCTGSPIHALQADALSEALHRYEMTIRWGKIEDLYQMLSPELLAKAVIPSNLENIKVIQYDILSPPTINGAQASQRIEIRYLHQDKQTIRTLVDQQLWVELSEHGWRRANPIPMFQ